MNLLAVRIIDKYIGGFLVFLLSLFKGVDDDISKEDFNNKNILVIKTWGLGNLVMLSPSLHAIKKKYPMAKITLLTLKSNKGLVDVHPLIETACYISNDSYVKTILEFLAFIKEKQKTFDLVLDFEQFAKVSSLVTFLIRPRFSIGFDNPSSDRNLLYSKSIPYTDHAHMVYSFGRILKPLNIILSKNLHYGIDSSNEFLFSRFPKKFNRHIDPNRDFIVVMHAGTSANCIRRRWPKEYFVKLIKHLIMDFHAKILLTGTQDDMETNDFISRNIDSDSLINSTMQLTIKDLLSSIRGSSLVVSNDTAPVHFASMFNIPTIAFFGPNTPFLYGSLSTKHINFSADMFCSPCINNYNYKLHHCRDPICITRLTFKKVYPEIKTFIQTQITS